MIVPMVIAILIAFAIISVLKDPFTWVLLLLFALAGGGYWLWETTDWNKVFAIGLICLACVGAGGLAFAIHDRNKVSAWYARRVTEQRQKYGPPPKITVFHIFPASFLCILGIVSYYLGNSHPRPILLLWVVTLIGFPFYLYFLLPDGRSAEKPAEKSGTPSN